MKLEPRVDLASLPEDKLAKASWVASCIETFDVTVLANNGKGTNHRSAIKFAVSTMLTWGQITSLSDRLYLRTCAFTW